MRRGLGLCWILLSFYVVCTSAVRFDLGQNAEDCFYEDMHVGHSVTMSFMVMSGPQQTVDTVAFDPQQNVIYADRNVGEGKFRYTAKVDGQHRFCFTNAAGHGVKSVHIAFDNESEVPEMSDLGKKDQVDRVHSYLHDLTQIAKRVAFTQQHYRLLSERHRMSLKAANSKVRIWTAFEILSIVVVSAFQIYFLRKMFSKKASKGLV
mmetsp:Transcript_18193/g.37915  ORF Transcript_18193/g.37915 Transcript_18193/m.37915 type:complete len:206 (-) Transcript_18193:570-1187(-)